MKNRLVHIMVLITCMFTAFTVGFLTGRNYNHSDVQVSSLSASHLSAADAAPVTTAEPTTLPPVQTTPRETQAPSLSAEETTEPEQKLIDINSATLEELTTLPGIGEVIAGRIIDYREANGPFSNIAQLTNVSGIGAKRFEAIMELITVQ